MPARSIWMKDSKILKSLSFILAMSILPSAPCRALSEADFARDFDRLALPLVERTALQYFTGKAGIRIAYRSVGAASGVPPLGAIVFVHGYSESMIKHAEIIYDLVQVGYQVFALDLRGMGQSDRLLPNPQVGHVEHFTDYVDDLGKFVDDIVTPQSPRPLYLLAHSLGGMISVELMAQRRTPFAAAIFSAPMFGIHTLGLPSSLVKTVLGFNLWRGHGREYRPGSGDYDISKSDASKSNVTHSIARAQRTLDLYRQRPELMISGQSNQWMTESIAATERAAVLAGRIDVPMKILQAEEDTVVTAEGQRDFCLAARHCELKVVTGARHEVLQENDSIRAPILSEILSFFASKRIATQ